MRGTLPAAAPPPSPPCCPPVWVRSLALNNGKFNDRRGSNNVENSDGGRGRGYACALDGDGTLEAASMRLAETEIGGHQERQTDPGDLWIDTDADIVQT